MQYITVKRYKRDNNRGRFNIPYGTEIEEHDGLLWYNGKDICGDHSAVMREYFRRNDDGRGLERENLVQAINKSLHDDQLWPVVWEDGLCQKYRKKAQADYWLWAIEFFNAPIEDLEYIVKLIGAKA